MKCYYFTVATENSGYFKDALVLAETASVHGIHVDIITGPKSLRKKIVRKKIKGILEAPDWADRIVFLDSDTMIANPEGLEDHNGARCGPDITLATHLPEWWRNSPNHNADDYVNFVQSHGMMKFRRGDPFIRTTWNAGVVVGEANYMRELAEEWDKWYGLIEEFFEGKMWNDQYPLQFAYETIHNEKYDYDDLPLTYNVGIARFGVPPDAHILHKAGCSSWTKLLWCKLREDILDGKYQGVDLHKEIPAMRALEPPYDRLSRDFATLGG